MEVEIKKCVEMLKQDKIILYPTDTVWGIGCDATNEEAIARIFRIKQRHESKSMLILLDKSDRLPLYVEKIPLIAWDLISHAYRPTTFIYPTAKNLPKQLIHPDGTIAIRIVNDPFCKKLISALGKPIISTSANLSGEETPRTYGEISGEMIRKVDHVVPEKFSTSFDFQPSRLIRFIDDYNFVIIRE
ncbi:MAG: threonylcarbamoyl-AMP synthase [Bacteroidales bacterium]|jgi:L-threonylcarbamoyladenylate synthase|nr:threonylcarbamoyl-AMP synthase [Bacteroidales bacterium]